MYSVVLMMALTTGGDLPAFHRGGGCYGGGCYGGSCCGYAGGCWGSCSGGCYGGCNGGCFGGHGRRGFRHRRGGCWGSSGCGCTGYVSCGCSGSYGGCFGGCTGYMAGCWGGCTGFTGGCWGGTMSAPVMSGPTPMPRSTTPPPPPGAPGKGPERVPPPKGTMAPVAASAIIIVSLPADATLRVDGHLTHCTSAVRTFASPALEPGKEYRYTLSAELVRNGRKVADTQQVSVRAGEKTNVRFDLGPTRVVQK